MPLRVYKETLPVRSMGFLCADDPPADYSSVQILWQVLADEPLPGDDGEVGKVHKTVIC